MRDPDDDVEKLANAPLSGWLGLALWLVASAAVASFGGLFGPGDWYGTINKPSFTPPGWVFGPVWTALYIAMAVAVWLVSRRDGWRANRLAISLYVVQLVFNALWSWIFFGQQEIGWALVNIVALWATIVVVMILFWRRNRSAGWLMLPYVLWVSFASFLNYSLWTLN